VKGEAPTEIAAVTPAGEYGTKVAVAALIASIKESQTFDGKFNHQQGTVLIYFQKLLFVVLNEEKEGIYSAPAKFWFSSSKYLSFLEKSICRNNYRWLCHQRHGILVSYGERLALGRRKH
jgi:hypothetical protein